MAEVGVLELTIRDNATEAAYGLSQVERKLKDAKTAAEQFDLSNVQSQITRIVQAVKDDNKTVSALGNLFNGIAKFAKVKLPTIAEEELKKLDDLKKTLGSGWNLGQAGTQLNKIHDALNLDWNKGNAENANTVLKKIADGVNAVSGTSIKTVANNIGLLADKMEKFAGAAKKISSSSGAHDIFMQILPSVSAQQVAETKKNVENTVKTAEEAKNRYTDIVSDAESDLANRSSFMDMIRFGYYSSSRPRKTKQSEGQIGMDLEGLTDAKTTVQELTDKFAEYKGLQDESLKYAQVDPSQFVAKPLEAVADVQQRMAEVTERMTSAVGAALPKVQQLSSEEMLIAGNAKQAAEAIERLINRLNTVQSSKGFSKLVDIYTGVTRNNTNLAESSAEAFASAPVEYFNNALQKTGDILSGVVVPKVREMYQMLGEMSDNLGWFKGPGQNVPKLMAGPDLHRPVDEDKMLSTYVDNYRPNWTYYDSAVAEQASRNSAVAEQASSNPAVGQLLDRLNNPENANRLFSEIVDTVTGVVRENANHIDPEQVSLLSIPAMDKEGPFEMASEEIAHYLPLLKRAREDLGFWGDKYEEVQKRIKYNGSTLEREQMLGQAEKGFYFSLAKVEEYEAALKRVYDYVEKYQKSGYGMGNIKGIYEDVRFGPTLAGLNGVDKQMELIGQIASNTGLSIDSVKQQLAELSHGTIQFGDDVHKTDSTVSQASKAGMEQFKKELEEITESTTPAMSKIELLRNKVTHLWSRVVELSEQPKVDIFGNDNGINNTINEYLLKIGRVNEQLQKLFENAHKAQKAAQFEEMKANSDDLQRDYGTEMVDNIVENYSQLDLLKMKMEGMKQALADDIDQNKVDTQQIAARTAAIQKLQEQIGILNNKENADNLQRDYGEEMVGNMMNNYSQIDLLTMKMDGLKQALADDINQNKVDTQQIADRVMAIQSLQDKIKALTEEQEKANSSTWSLGASYESLKASMKKMFPTISGLLKRFKSMAIMRGMRYIVRQIASGVSEGIKNLYEYSKAVGTEFAPSMDNAASSLLYMKNSIGAALAPAIMALVPVLQTVVNWFVSLVNVANQFIALLTGQSTWTQAIQTQTEAYTDNSKKAKQAAKDAKDLLADWDELNIIQSQNNGGGSGASGKTEPNYAGMFQEVKEFDGWIKDLVDGIERQFGDVWGLVKRIGLAILGWKFSNAFSGLLGTLGGLIAAGAIIDLMFNLTTMFNGNFLKTGDVGWLVADVLTTAIGAYFTKKVLTKVLGTGAGYVGAAVSLVVSATADIIALMNNIDTNALSFENIMLAIKGSLKLGAGAGLVAKAAGATTAQAFGIAAGAGLLAFGIMVDIKALKGAIDSGNIKVDDAFKTGLAGALAFGLGVSILEIVAGASAGTVIAAGAASALALGLGFTVALGIIAMMNADRKHVEWGDVEHTREELQAYVDNNGFFTINVDATVKLVKTTTEGVENKRQEITTELSSFFVNVDVVTLGLATEETYKNMKEQLFGADGQGGIIGDLKGFAQEQKTVIQTSMSLVPLVNSEGKQDKELTAEVMKQGITGWNEVNAYMTTLGNDLSASFRKGSIDGLEGFDDDYIKALTNKLSNVSNAVLGSNIGSKALGKLQLDLGDISQKDAKEILNIYSGYRNDLRESFNEMLTEELTSYQGLAAFYRARGNAGDDKLAEYWENQAQTLMDTWDARIEAAVDRYSAPGKRKIYDAIAGKLLLNKEDVQKMIGNGGGFKDATLAMGAFNFGNEIYDHIYNNMALSEDEAKQRFKEAVLDPILAAIFAPEDLKIVKAALAEGVLDYTDLFDDSTFDMITFQYKDQKVLSYIKERWAEMKAVAEQNKKEALQFKQDMNIEDTLKDIGVLSSRAPMLLFGQAEEKDITVDAAPVFSTESVQQTKENASELTTTARETAMEVNNYHLDELTFDTTDARVNAGLAADAIEDMASRIRAAFESLRGLSFEMSALGGSLSGSIDVIVPKIEKRASGGFVKSADLVMANENGEFEMMGKMGNQPVVANNQQIVSGISRGVSEANGDVVGELRTVTTLMQRMLAKRWIAESVPSSRAGRANQQSADAYAKVTG